MEFIDRYAHHELAVRAQKVMTAGVTRGTLYMPPFIPFAASAGGYRVRDQFDHDTIDLCNNYTALIHGHAHPETTEVIREVAMSGTAVSLPTKWDVKLAELLAARTLMPHWRFCNSGTEAVMSAIRCARAFTGRDVIIKFAGSYHGTANDVVRSGAAGLTKSHSFDVIECPPGEIAALREIVAAHSGEIAAVIIDLMPNRAGLIPADPDYVRDLRVLTQEQGILLIVDEVISLRIGPGGLAREYGLDPDLITAGKIIGGGLPVGALGGKPQILSVFHPASESNIDWGGTFSANPLSMAAGHATLTAFGAEEQTRVDRLGDQLRANLNEKGVQVRGRGSLSRIMDERFSSEVWWRIYEMGLLLGTNGLMCLSTPMSSETIDEIESTLIEAFDR